MLFFVTHIVHINIQNRRNETFNSHYAMKLETILVHNEQTRTSGYPDVRSGVMEGQASPVDRP